MNHNAVYRTGMATLGLLITAIDISCSVGFVSLIKVEAVWKHTKNTRTLIWTELKLAICIATPDYHCVTSSSLETNLEIFYCCCGRRWARHFLFTAFSNMYFFCVCSVQWAVSSEQWAVCSVQCAVFGVHCSVGSVQFSVCSVQCYSLYCRKCKNQYFVQNCTWYKHRKV